ncbi:serine/threonine-protein kinase [Microseira wollei]|uniref:WD-40 repeat-containing serine/threonine protein kinase n=1 Tax=Microseira wollei NIES-4236 TaxID=2530354 RepID=A0AAV3XEU7_9CYAN|nr:serine/threonine-protein kinase [Microseira wollei]GET40879.1 WD-40 repeat-containing serine/threonine protein kinase [Microseira wollei NIES-4236]
MSYCLNPKCSNSAERLNANSETCCHCGSDLLLQGRYRVVRFLGEGGFGKTFEVDDGGTPKVLKVLSNNDPKAVSLFQQEAKVLSQLRHPGIPKVEAKGYFTFQPKDSTEPLHCLVMEKIEGVNLLELLRKRSYKPISQAQAIAWLKQLTIILGQVHQQQYFHRDIKPTNIMLRTPSISSSQLGNKRDQLVLIDFGTAREVTSTYLARIGGAHQVTGLVSAGYTPPEQVDGRAMPQSDFYALGRRFVHLLTGRPPNSFAEDSQGNLLWRNGAKHVSKPLADLINYLMAPLPGNRPQDTKEILHCLEKIESHFKSPASQSIRVQTTTPTARLQNKTGQNILSKKAQNRIRWRIIAVLVMTGFLLFSLSDIIFSFRYFYPYLDGKIISPVARFWNCNSRPKAPLLHTLCNDSSTFNSSIVISPDGQTLISSDYNNGIKLWNLQTGKLKSTLSKSKGDFPFGTIAISPDGQTLISSNFMNDIRLWNLQTGKLRSIPIDNFSIHRATAISPDGQILVNKGLETIELWNLRTGEWLRSINTGEYSLRDSITISQNGQILVTSGLEMITEQAGYATIMRSGNTAKLWNLKTGELIRTISIGDKAIAISSDNKTLISFNSWSYRGGTIKLWNLQTGELRNTLTGSLSRVNSIVISPDGRILASTGEIVQSQIGSTTTYKTADFIELWNLQTGELLRTIPVKQQTWLREATIAISPDSQTLASFGFYDGTIELWNLQTGQLKTTLKSHFRGVSAIAFTPDSKTLVSSSSDGTIKVWRVP